jgi:glycosyltransferase involved in cell wall biosynthesis
LHAIGVPLRLTYSDITRLNPDFINWLALHPEIKTSLGVRVPGGMTMRFVEETVDSLVCGSGRVALYTNYFLPFGAGNASSVIIHDCQHRVYPQYFSGAKRKWLDYNFSRTLRHAASTLLISEFERTQIARFYGDHYASRCKVVYNGVDWSRYCGGSGKSLCNVLDKKYILTVAHQYPHKNTLKVIQAFVLMAVAHSDTFLVLVGKPSVDVKNYIACLDQRLRSRIMLAGFVSDAELGVLYRGTALFVSASAYEGFGMPAVEAMGFGVPVLVSSGTSLREVTLGGATYCDEAATPSEWATAFADCLKNKPSAEYLSLMADSVRRRFAPPAVAASVLSSIAQ